ncbi:MAG: acetylglutamate kinase [Terriglobia bacterium]
MTIVVKIGGQAQEDAQVRRSVARQIAVLCRSGHKVVVVHGGGKVLTETLQKLGIPTRFHQGLRVTDRATRDVALMVLAGIVNKQWVAELDAQGIRALGICGGDAKLARARKLAARSNGQKKDLGFVGRPHKFSPAILNVAFRSGMVPVVASLALGPGGEYFNVNADDFAAALASELKADRLLYLTESGGVWDAEQRLLPVVKVGEIRRLIQKQIVRDGMIPKLRSCARTLRHDVGEIDILSPAAVNGLVRAVASEEPVGTRVVK